MNPATVASSFSVQKISKHHFLIRGDERVRSYMNFRELKWSKTYQGWLVHEDDDIDLVQMHVEVLDNVRQEAKQKMKKSKKKKQVDEDDLYERFKRGEEITDDEEDEYVPEEEEEEEEAPEGEDKTDDYEEDSFVVKDSTDEEAEEWTKKEKKNNKKVKVIDEPEEASEDESDEEEDQETDPKRKREFQFYKKGILAYGMMPEKQRDKVEAVWNKHLRGWIIRKSYLEKLQKMGWTDVEAKAPEVEKEKDTIIHTPQVVRKESKPEEKTFTKYKNMLLVKGGLSPDLVDKTSAIFHNELGGSLVTETMRSLLLENGFTEKDIVVSVQFSEGKKLPA
jgi:hypothetical protein